MNNEEFKRHLKALAAGHHHPEEHDWGEPAAAPKKAAKAQHAKTPARKTAKRK